MMGGATATLLSFLGHLVSEGFVLPINLTEHICLTALELDIWLQEQCRNVGERIITYI